MNKQTAQTLAELFPHKTAEGNFQDGFQLDPWGELFFLRVWKGDTNALVTSIPSFELRGNLDPHREALIEKTLELIAEREDWRVQTVQRFTDSIFESFEVKIHWKVKGRIKRNGAEAEGSTKLEAMTAAMIAAKQGQP